MLFSKPIGVLARQVEVAKDEPMCGPDPRITIEILQNGFKVRCMGSDFVAKTLDEAKDIAGRELSKLIADLKKKDK